MLITLVPVADLHYSVGPGLCRDTDKTPCSGDPDTATWLADALDAEQPDLVASLDHSLRSSLCSRWHDRSSQGISSMVKKRHSTLAQSSPSSQGPSSSDKYPGVLSSVTRYPPGQEDPADSA